MIRINNRPSTPQTLLSVTVVRAKADIERIVAQRGKADSVDFPSGHWRKPDVRDALWSSQKGKCCFCENKRAKKREFDAEHYRPKSKVTEEQNHPGYWWLAYEWSNLLYACKPCNQEHKKNHFPLINSQERARQPSDSLSRERSVLINPITENPEESIGFEWGMAFGMYVKAVGLDSGGENRGGRSIQILGLNREELMQERAELLDVLVEVSGTMAYAERTKNDRLVKRMEEKVRKLTSSERRFAGFVRAFFRAQGFGNLLSSD